MTLYHCKYRENSNHLFLLNLSCNLPAPSSAAQTPFYPVNQDLAGGNGAALSRLHCLDMVCAGSLFQCLACITNLHLQEFYFKVLSDLSQAPRLCPTFNYTQFLAISSIQGFLGCNLPSFFLSRHYTSCSQQLNLPLIKMSCSGTRCSRSPLGIHPQSRSIHRAEHRLQEVPPSHLCARSCSLCRWQLSQQCCRQQTQHNREQK